MLLLMGFSTYSNSRKRWKTGLIEYKPWCWRIRKLGFLKFPQFHIMSDCEDSLSDKVFLPGTKFMTKKCSYLCNKILFILSVGNMFPGLNSNKNCKALLDLHHSPDLTTVFGTNRSYLPTPRFAQILLNMQKYFPNHWSMEIILHMG